MICTPAERDLIVAGATQLVAPGDLFPATGCDTCAEDHTTDYHYSHDHAQYHGGRNGAVAPQRWVDATGPCPHPYINEATGKCVWDGKDCIDGRKREALTVAVGYAPSNLGDPPDAERELCVVTFAYATVEVLPVVQFTGKQETPSGRYVLLGSQPDDPTVLIPNEVVIPLNPLPVPGRDWVVLLNNVELT